MENQVRMDELSQAGENNQLLMRGSLLDDTGEVFSELGDDMSDNRTTTCPDCNGSGETLAFFPCYGPDHKGPRKPVLEMKCHRCKGEKVIPVEMLIWIATGKQLREERLARNMTLRKEAERLGVSPTVLSAMEQGMTFQGHL